ncbi:MAG: acetyl-CoA carboxylase biotin carboxyl carrier protein [Blautia sp.]|nr:acetyl-CoA carboxylase biotin carboxyl carrier protein [Blautia sp.]
MEFEKIIELIQTVSDSNLMEFHFQEGNLNISMSLDKSVKVQTVSGEPSGLQVLSQAVSETEQASENDRKIVKSPLVGTYYEASSPDSDPFVKVGDQVKKGQILGIVEAMKLMNEIESEFDGKVKEILVKNGQIIEFGQPMFVIE